MNLRFATETDAPAIIRLVNQAFVVESFFKVHDRTHSGEIESLMSEGRFLLLEDERDLAGSVYVKVTGDRGYLGMLAVDPTRQRAGIGRRLMAAAEEFFREQGCRVIDISIVNLRTELPPLYEKFGYRVTGRAPFPADQMPVKQDCWLVLMEKQLGHR